jgi:hypothetical protein
MTLSDVPANPLPNFFKGLWSRFSFREKRIVDVCGTITAGPSDENLAIALVPFQYGAWCDAKLSTNFGRN